MHSSHSIYFIEFCLSSRAHVFSLLLRFAGRDSRSIHARFRSITNLFSEPPSIAVNTEEEIKLLEAAKTGDLEALKVSGIVPNIVYYFYIAVILLDNMLRHMTMLDVITRDSRTARLIKIQLSTITDN